VVEQLKTLAALGINQAIFNMPAVHEITPLEIFGRSSRRRRIFESLPSLAS
jgi:hypothetical protein